MTRLMKDRGAFPQPVLASPDPPSNRPGEKKLNRIRTILRNVTVSFMA